MIEFGLDSTGVDQIITGSKTAEARLRTPKFVTVRIGDILSIRQDSWLDGVLVSSIADKVRVLVTGTIFFDSFTDMLDAMDFKQFMPTAVSSEEVKAFYQQFYVIGQQQEHGVMAIRFKLL